MRRPLVSDPLLGSPSAAASSQAHTAGNEEIRIPLEQVQAEEGSHFALEKEEEVVDLKPSFRGCRTDGQRDREFGWRKWNVEGNRGSAARYPFDCLRLGSPRKELLA
ncbi:hypothetical protein BHE74_00045190 [Ensete ventricosum]|nr:hypothetical protein BHE74_00045190 [Ensete ventricosum]